jgi:serine/threonine protein phosphatase PrpC
VCFLDLGEVEARSPTLSTQPLGIALCSDGIWDNWKFEEVSQFLLDGKCVEAAAAARSAQDVVSSLMSANLSRAARNFGSSADNMTAIVAYLLPTPPRV